MSRFQVLSEEVNVVKGNQQKETLKSERKIEGAAAIAGKNEREL